MSGDLSFRQINYGSYFYQMECDLRNRILREPLGLNLFDEDLAIESTYQHFGGFLGKIIACAVIIPENINVVQIKQMAVDEQYQGMGYGYHFMTKLCVHLRNRGVESVWLETRKSAAPFYQKLDFVIIGQEFTKLTLPHFRMELALK